MKIGLVSSDQLKTPPMGDRYGGLERVVWSLARQLALRGHEVSLYALPGSRAPERVELVEVTDSNHLLTAEGERDLLQHEVIHCHDWNLVGWQLAQHHPGRAVFMTWHGPYLGARVGYQPPPENLFLCGISRWHATLLEAETGAERVEAVYNGIELSDFPLYEGPREPYLAYLNRLAAEKGLHLAIRLLRDLPDYWSLRAAGTERYVGVPGYVHAMLRRMDGRRVRFEGDLGQQRKYELLSRATALIWLPVGFEEPFGLGIVEAMACGTPVIALDRGDIRELVPEETILPGVSRNDLGHALTMANYKVGRPLRELAERFSAERMAEGYLDVYVRGLAVVAARSRHFDAADGEGAGAVQELEVVAEGLPSLSALPGGLAGELQEGVDRPNMTVEPGDVDLVEGGAD